MNIKTYLLLIRPANIITAFSDILAGAAIAYIGLNAMGYPTANLFLLLISTLCLYGGGIAYNDVCDAKLDAIERPERPIPSGKISIEKAKLFVFILFGIGIFTAFANHFISGVIAIGIALAAVLYDARNKHHPIFGPINMGICRGGNLLLGISILPAALLNWFYLAFIPIVYIAAITAISRGEVHGGNKKTLIFSTILYGIVHLSQFVIAWKLGSFWLAFPFILLHIFLVFRPLIKAIKQPSPQHIGLAVKAGVLSLIVMNAAWVGVSGDWLMAIMVLLLLPVSMRLAKVFAVT